MSRAVQISRLSRRRQYAGFLYTRTLGRIGDVTLTWHEWAEATDGMRLTLLDDGSILGHVGAELRLEVYERPEAKIDGMMRQGMRALHAMGAV